MSARQGARPAQHPDGMLTWRFRADNARDVAVSASSRYVWDATHATVDGKTVLINAFYRPGASSWPRAAEFTRFSVEHLSETFIPYPYPHMTVVEGIIRGGIEYPMITLIGGTRNDRSLFGVIYHETSHMWFPMIVGTNEKSFTWMDEGADRLQYDRRRRRVF